jgi:hypothetical protein
MDDNSALWAQEVLHLWEANARLQAHNEQLRAEKAQLETERGQLQTQKGELVVEKELLQQELKELKRVIFGQKRERFVPAAPANQLFLPLEAQPIEPVATVKQTISYERAVKQAAKLAIRGGFPSHLPRVDVLIEPEGDVSGMRKMDLPIRSCILGPARRSLKNWT